MKVTIGATASATYDGEACPIMVTLTPQDRENIANMAPDATKYAVFPDDWGTPDEMRAWMQQDG